MIGVVSFLLSVFTGLFKKNKPAQGTWVVQSVEHLILVSAQVMTSGSQN